jgi:hypothetical protein
MLIDKYYTYHEFINYMKKYSITLAKLYCYIENNPQYTCNINDLGDIIYTNIKIPDCIKGKIKNPLKLTHDDYRFLNLNANRMHTSYIMDYISNCCYYCYYPMVSHDFETIKKWSSSIYTKKIHTTTMNTFVDNLSKNKKINKYVITYLASKSTCKKVRDVTFILKTILTYI